MAASPRLEVCAGEEEVPKLCPAGPGEKVPATAAARPPGPELRFLLSTWYWLL